MTRAFHQQKFTKTFSVLVDFSRRTARCPGSIPGGRIAALSFLLKKRKCKLQLNSKRIKCTLKPKGFNCSQRKETVNWLKDVYSPLKTFNKAFQQKESHLDCMKKSLHFAFSCNSLIVMNWNFNKTQFLFFC